MENNTKECQLTDKVSQNWQVGKNLGACMQVMYDSNLWTDVQFRCKDHDEGERIHAHKIILAARSPVFQELFYGSHAENKDELELPDTEKDVFDMFLRYIYTDTVAVEEGTAYAVLLVANRYQVSGLAKFCEDYLSTIITTENACKFLGIALCHNMTSLRDACCSYIDQNADKVLNSEGFIELSKDALLHILKGDTFYAKEDAIFLKAEEWAIKRIEERGLERNGATIKQTLGESFYYLRLPTMTYKMLMTSTRNKGYFSAEEYIDMADYINGLPDTRIITNSCVARVPQTETLQLNQNVQNEIEIQENIQCSIEVSVSKDTELVSFCLGSIEPYLVYKQKHYTGQRNPVYLSTASKADRLQNYSGKVIQVEDMCEEIRVVELNAMSGQDLGEHVRLNLNGRISGYGVDPPLNQEFSIFSSRKENEIYLKPPVILRKDDRPFWRYRITISIHTSRYGYNSEVKMKTKRNQLLEDVLSKTGHVKISGNNIGVIKNITIKNFTNREAES